MVNLEEILLNGRLRQSHLWESRQRSEEATLKARALCTPIRYLRKEILPIPASQIFPLHLPVLEEARRTRRPPLPGKRKGSTFPLPGQKLRKQGTRQRKNSSNSVITPSPHSLIEQPGTGTGAASPEGEVAQGPSSSPVDYNLICLKRKRAPRPPDA
jgi:hypothetical protein